jgi:asparagine synthase (glutamine-hydrolysing)
MHLILSVNHMHYSRESEDNTTIQNHLTCWLLGYFRHKNSPILFDKEAAEYAIGLYEQDLLDKEARYLNGSFALILCDNQNKEAIIVTDRLGSVPVYFGQRNGNIYISDNYWQVVQDIGEQRLNQTAIAQLIQYSYVLGTDTIIENVSEFAPHTIFIINYSNKPNISKQSYWTFQLQEYSRLSESELLDASLELYSKIFGLYSDVIKKNKWVAGIPLSGGMDSRLITWGLAKNNVPLITASYGTSSGSDLLLAIQVAEKLNIRQEIIIWENEKPFTGKVHDVLNALIGFTTAYSQGVGAYAITEKCSDSCDVFLPGHMGDVIAGNHISYLNMYLGNLLTNSIVERSHKLISDRQLQSLFPWAASHIKQIRSKFIETTKIEDDPTILSLTQRWDVEQRQRRLILRECPIFRMKGHKVVMPLGDYEILDFFMSLPRKYLYKQYFYRKLMTERIYTGEYSFLGDIDTPKGMIFPLGTKAKIPGVIEVASIIMKLIIKRFMPSTNKNISSTLLSLTFWNIWYHSPKMRQYFIDQFRDYSHIQNRLDIEAINELIKIAPHYFVNDLVYNIATITHPIFRDYI